MKDLKGQKFGNLTAIEYIGGSKWKCKCDCGEVAEVLTNRLTNGKTKNCGKCNKIQIGDKFGRLTTVKKVEVGKWLCQCECGNTCTVATENLKLGKTKSCGCYQKEQVKKLFVGGTMPSRLISEPTKSNKSGVVGVNWDKSRGKWQASIRFKGRKYNLGRFEFIQDAIDIRKTAEKEIFGEFLKWYETSNKKRGGN